MAGHRLEKSVRVKHKKTVGIQTPTKVTTTISNNRGFLWLMNYLLYWGFAFGPWGSVNPCQPPGFPSTLRLPRRHTPRLLWVVLQCLAQVAWAAPNVVQHLAQSACSWHNRLVHLQSGVTSISLCISGVTSISLCITLYVLPIRFVTSL